MKLLGEGRSGKKHPVYPINKSWEPLNGNKRCTSFCLVAHWQTSWAISQLFDIVHVFVKSLCMCELLIKRGGGKLSHQSFVQTSLCLLKTFYPPAYIDSQIVSTLWIMSHWWSNYWRESFVKWKRKKEDQKIT